MSRQHLVDIGVVEPRPISEYHEDMGDVLWWKLPITEPPYVGSPNSLGQEVVIRMPTVGHCIARVDRDASPNAMKPKKIKNPGGTFFVGGWPGYHTHFTPIPIPALKPQAAASCGRHGGNCVCQQAGECINT